MKHEISFFTYIEDEIKKAQDDDLNPNIEKVVKNIPDLMGLLIRLVMDNRLTKDQRLYIASALVYLMSPEDFIPERSMGVKGLVEDAILVAQAVHFLYHDELVTYLNEQWRGHEPLEKTIDSIIETIPQVVTSEISDLIELYLRTNRPIR